MENLRPNHLFESWKVDPFRQHVSIFLYIGTIPLYSPPVDIYDSKVLYTSIWKEVMRENWVMEFWPFHPFYTKTSVGEENFDECVRCTKLLSDSIALIFVMFRPDLMESLKKKSYLYTCQVVNSITPLSPHNKRLFMMSCRPAYFVVTS